jgi:hypothetical protein
MSIVSIFLAAVFLVDPPVRNIWAFAELSYPTTDKVISERCGFQSVEVLAVTAFQKSSEGMTLDQQEAWVELKERIVERYPIADFREQAMLVKELNAFGGRGERTRLVDAAWVRLDSMRVDYYYVYDAFTDGAILKIEDETTGSYISILHESEDPEQVGLIVQELLESEDGVAAAIRLVKDSDRSGRVHEILVDVNGAALYLDQADPQDDKSLTDIIALLWGYISNDEARNRLEIALPVIWMAVDDESIFDGLRLKWYTDPQKTPHDDCVIRGAEFVNGQKGGSLISLEGPPPEVLEQFFGKPMVPLPDPDLSFKKLTRELL